MRPVFKSLLVAGLMATAGLASYAQGMGPSGDRPPMRAEGGMHRMDPARMEKMVARRLAELKAKLKITSDQESAWTTFAAAMKPPVRDAEKRPDRAELDKLTTPERIDKMHALRTQRLAEMNAAMDQRDDATKTFYATLSPEQKKVFDSEHARMGERHGDHHKPLPPTKDGKPANAPAKP